MVPAGSGNGLARELRVPPDWRGALRVVRAGKTRTIDLGRVAGDDATTRLFVNVAGVGFDAHVARAFEEERRGRSGRLGLRDYARLTVRELRRYTPAACRVVRTNPDTTAAVSCRPLLIAVANSAQYGNGARIAPHARPDDGVLDLVVVEATSPWRDLWRARRLFTGTMARDRGATLLRATKLRVEGDEELPAHVDGQPFAAGRRLDVEVWPRALRVLVP